MAQHQISIIGAGLAGLVLGRCLLSRGIRAVLYERDKAGPRFGYGITLRSSAYRSLLPILGLEEDAFRNKIAVEGSIGGQGRQPSHAGNDGGFRANRLKFEELLSEGLDVRWEHKLTSVNPQSGGLSLEFDNGEKAETGILVGADGVHSQIRKTISPSSDFNILPFVVYNGKRRLKPATFDEKYAPYLSEVNILSHEAPNALLQISVNERTSEKASISYTYSRPAQAQQSNDPLFRPTRSIPGATNIPPEFFTEIDALQDLEEPFKEVFNSAAMKDDRLLNWLMRSILVEKSDLDDAVGKGIVLLGDACHHGPILGSDGANQAIEDAVELAELLARDGEQMKLGEFYASRYSVWKKYVRDNEAELARMHGRSRSSL